MKFNFELTNIEVEGVQVGGVKIETELTISEMVAIRSEQERFLKKLPEYITDFSEVVSVFDKIDSEMREKQHEEHIAHFMREAVRRAMAKSIRVSTK